MTKRKGRKHTPEVEAQLVLATLMSDQTLAERAHQYDIHPNQITDSFRLDAVRDAIRRHGCPEIFNTDQACPFTSGESTGLLKAHDIRISMDGKGLWRAWCANRKTGRAATGFSHTNRQDLQSLGQTT